MRFSMMLVVNNSRLVAVRYHNMVKSLQSFLVALVTLCYHSYIKTQKVHDDPIRMAYPE